MTENRENNQPISEALHTDCMAYMRSLPDNYFDLAIADPPYRRSSSTNCAAYRAIKSSGVVTSLPCLRQSVSWCG